LLLKFLSAFVNDLTPGYGGVALSLEKKLKSTESVSNNIKSHENLKHEGLKGKKTSSYFAIRDRIGA